jgi:hypothetical protein
LWGMNGDQDALKRRHAHTFHVVASFRQVKSTAANRARKRDQTR